ncbi:unnamed protein product, partial [Ectocarpus sp. 12 AP-2014]
MKVLGRENGPISNVNTTATTTTRITAVSIFWSKLFQYSTDFACRAVQCLRFFCRLFLSLKWPRCVMLRNTPWCWKRKRGTSSLHIYFFIFVAIPLDRLFVGSFPLVMCHALVIVNEDWVVVEGSSPVTMCG